MVLQNTTSGAVAGNYHMWNAAGALQNGGNTTLSLVANATFVQNTSVVAGGSGSNTVTNNSGYGALAGKAVAVEPATGFTFDTPLSCRPH
jgi:hypothetical protein